MTMTTATMTMTTTMAMTTATTTMVTTTAKAKATTSKATNQQSWSILHGLAVSNFFFIPEFLDVAHVGPGLRRAELDVGEVGGCGGGQTDRGGGPAGMVPEVAEEVPHPPGDLPGRAGPVHGPRREEESTGVS